MGTSFSLTGAEKKFLSRLARMSIEAGLVGKVVEAVPALPEVLDNPQSMLRRHLGGFVTISIENKLRGCIGSIVGQEPLYRNIWRMAASAAFSDPRFPPLRLEEWRNNPELEISVLDELTPCLNPEAIEVGRHGLVLQYQHQSGVFLPQVPVEQGWDRLSYLENLCTKAGVPKNSWQQPLARLFWFEALVFPA
ncbi:MAG: AmmeMemoRadiSam system protein A [Desulfovibrio sp.]|nr:AmmeMemoRadiSam system protein A [Desulfovibrio sp.]